MGKKRTKKLPPTLSPLVVSENPSAEDLMIQDAEWSAHRENWAKRLQKRYEDTGNPLAAWDAYLMARRKGEPVPDFVFEYLDRVAENLLKAENKKEYHLRIEENERP